MVLAVLKLKFSKALLDNRGSGRSEEEKIKLMDDDLKSPRIKVAPPMLCA